MVRLPRPPSLVAFDFVEQQVTPTWADILPTLRAFSFVGKGCLDWIEVIVIGIRITVTTDAQTSTRG